MANELNLNLTIQSIFAKAQAALSSGSLSSSIFRALYAELKAQLVIAAKDMAVSGYEKKQLVMNTITKFIDEYLPLPLWLFWLRPIVKKFMLWAADGAIETLYRTLFPPTPPAPATP